MNNRNGALSFDAYIGDTDFNRTIQSMNKKMEWLTNRTMQESQKMESVFSNIGRLAAGGLAAAGLSQLPQQIVRVRGEFQQLEISFTTMLQSKEKADKLMADVTKFAAVTPYGLKDTAAATKQLLAYGESADTVVSTLTKLGDIAAGIGAPLGDIAYLYGTTMTQGRLYTQDLNQFTGRGIPMIRELAAIFKVAESEVKGLVEAGKVGFPEVQQVIANLTKEGSMFGGLMEAQSKSLVGLQAQLGDAVDAMFNDIGRSQEGLLSATFKGAIGVVENYEKVVDVLKVVIATYGAYRAAVMLTAAVQSSAIILGEVQAFIALARSIKTAADAQALLNLAVRANPYVLAATALAALVTAFVVFGDNASEAEKIQAKFNETVKATEDALASEQAKVMSLTAQINNEKSSREQRNRALQELINLSPAHLQALTLENVKTTEGVTAINNYIEAKKRQIELKEIDAQLEESIKRQNAARRGENDLSFWDKLSLSASAASGATDYSKSSAAERKRLNGEMAQSEAALQQQLQKRVAAITGVDKAVVKSADTAAKATKKTVENYNEEIKALKEKQDKTSSNAEFSALDKQIKALEKQRDAITGGGSGKTKAATAKAAKAESDTRVKTFAEEIEEKKRMYELYERWVLNYGKVAADEQFAALIGKNKDYLAYVNSEIQRLETMRDVGYAGKLSDTDRFDLDRLLSERSELTGGKSAIQKFQEQLDNARDSSTSLTEELIKLKQIQDGLDPNDTSVAGRTNRQALAEREIEVQKQRKQMLDEFLVNVIGSEEKRLEITKHYADLRAALEKKALDKNSDGYKKALAAIDDGEKRELQEFSQEAITASKAYKELEKALALTKKNDTGKRLELLRKELAALPEGTEEYIRKLKEVKDAEEDHKRHSMETWGAIAGIVGDLGAALEGYEGAIGQIGGSLSGLASAAAKVSSTFANMDNYKNSDGKMSMDGYVAAAQNVIQIITGVIDAQKRRREAEKQFAVERIGFENEYSLALIKKQRQDYGDNPFYTDYEGKVKAGVEAYKSAFDKYQDAIDKLEEGRVKERQKNVVDGKTTLQMAGAGAAAGAIVGSVLPGVGTAIGAVVGGVVGAVAGLFSKKKKDVYGALMDQYPELVTQTAEGWAELNVEMAQALITNNQVDDKTKEMLSNAIALNEELENAKNQVRDVATELTGQLGDNLRDALVEAFKAGDTAANALRKTVGAMIADVASKLLFSKMLGPVFDRLIDDMTKAIAEEGSPVSALDKFGQYGLPAVESYFSGLDYLDQWLKDKGYDSIRAETAQAQAMQGSIKGMSEETASVLVGQFNAVRIYQAQMAFDVRSSLVYLNNIEINTRQLSQLRLLVDVIDRLDRLNTTSLRGFGL